MIHPDYLLRQLTSHQLAEWVAYFNRVPFGADVENWMRAQLAQIVANRLRPKNEPAAELKDFLPLYREPEQSPEEIKAILRGVFTRGGKYHRKDDRGGPKG